MGIFDKLTNAAKKATALTETYTQKVQEAITSPSISASQKKPNSQQKEYIPKPYNLLESIPSGSEDTEPWTPIVGKSKEFPLAGQILRIPENLDAYNSYRMLFHNLVTKHMNLAKADYEEKIHDFVSFMENLPVIYDTHLYPIMKRAIDILVAENVWTLTLNSFSLQHKAAFHSAIEIYECVIDTANRALEANRQITSNVVSFTTGLLGNKIGRHQLTSELFNSLKEEAEEKTINQTGINLEQQVAIYEHIDSQEVITCIFNDYKNVLISLVNVLNDNSHNIWLPTSELVQQSNNIYQNISNPSFPKDKITDAFIGMLTSNPYNPDYYELMISHFGRTEETVAISSYFGYNTAK